MLNMNLALVALGFAGCFLYICSMSALGRWLAQCRENSSIVYVAPGTHGTVGATF